MATDTDTQNCTLTCWAIAGLAGAALTAIFVIVGEWRWIQGIFVSSLVAVVLGLVLSRFICSGGTARQDLAAVRAGERGLHTSRDALARDMPRGDADRASGRGTGEKAAVLPTDLAPEPVKAPPADVSPAPVAAPAPVDPAAAPAAVAPAPAPAAEPVDPAPVAAGGKPALMDAPRDGGADDLKRISGVGPKLEGMLNDLGVWHFDQIAAWGPREIAWVDDNLDGFNGRIERDDWVSQARALADGSRTT